MSKVLEDFDTAFTSFLENNGLGNLSDEDIKLVYRVSFDEFVQHTNAIKPFLESAFTKAQLISYYKNLKSKDVKDIDSLYTTDDDLIKRNDGVPGKLDQKMWSIVKDCRIAGYFYALDALSNIYDARFKSEDGRAIDLLI